MGMTLVLLAVSIGALVVAGQTAQAAPLFSRCFNETVAGQKINNICLVLSRASDPPCTVDMALSISGSPVLNKNLGSSLAPQICETIPQLPLCRGCVNIVDNPNNADELCVSLDVNCLGVDPVTRDMGCFPKSALQDIYNCQNQQCLNQCSNNGQCVDQECQCKFGFYGDDCSKTTPQISECVKLNALQQEVCLDMGIAGGCKITVLGRLGSGLKLFNQSYSAVKFKTEFLQAASSSGGLVGNGKDLCLTVSSGCSFCLKFNNLVVQDNPPKFSVCPAATATCAGIPYSQSFKCFNDETGEFASCLVSCPKDCSKHGTCVKGVCKCSTGYSGIDCMTRDGGKSPGSGESVSEAPTSGSQDDGLVVLIIIVVIVFIVAGAGFAWWYKKKKQGGGGAQFTRFQDGFAVNAEEGDSDNGPIDLESSSDEGI